MAAWPLGSDSIVSTLPTCTPRILTLASGFMTRPARCEITVTGTVWVKSPANRPSETATMAPITRIVANPASGRAYDRALEWRPDDAATGRVDRLVRPGRGLCVTFLSPPFASRRG